MSLNSRLSRLEKPLLVQWIGKLYVNTVLAGFPPMAIIGVIV
jgi:hypothetical protein